MAGFHPKAQNDRIAIFDGVAPRHVRDQPQGSQPITLRQEHGPWTGKEACGACSKPLSVAGATGEGTTTQARVRFLCWQPVSGSNLQPAHSVFPTRKPRRFVRHHYHHHLQHHHLPDPRTQLRNSSSSGAFRSPGADLWPDILHNSPSAALHDIPSDKCEFGFVYIDVWPIFGLLLWNHENYLALSRTLRSQSSFKCPTLMLTPRGNRHPGTPC